MLGLGNDYSQNGRMLKGKGKGQGENMSKGEIDPQGSAKEY